MPNAITIDATGTVPIIGSSATTTVVYVHNNTNSTISGISYSSSNNNNTSALHTSFLQKVLGFFSLSSSRYGTTLQNSGSLCSTIPANGSCPLSYTTPTPSGAMFQGATTITLKYNYAGKSQQYSSIINYSTVNTSTQGVNITSGVIIPSDLNNAGYGMVYVYGGGKNALYTVDNLSINQPGLQIVQGNIVNTQVQSGLVEAIEIYAPATPKGAINAQLSLSSQETTSLEKFISIQSVVVQSIPSVDGAYLTSGFAPVANTATQQDIVLPITNAGNQGAYNVSVSYPSGISAGPSVDNQCGSSIDSYTSCNISLTIDDTSTSGSGDVTIFYDNGVTSSVTQTVVYYNNSSPLVGMYSSVSPISFNANDSQNATITITNYGSISLSNISGYTNPTIGSGDASVTYLGNDSCYGATLAYGASCQFDVNVSSSSGTNGYILVSVSAEYYVGGYQTYTRVLAIPYVVTANQPSLSISMSPTSFSLIGDGLQTQTATLSIANSGAYDATIASSGLVNAPDYLSASGSCGDTIASGDTCSSITLTLGPVMVYDTTTLSDVTFDMSYYGGAVSSGNAVTVSGAIDGTITPNYQAITLSDVSYTSSSPSGDGESSASPFVFSGYVTSQQSITLTYRNDGTNPIKITGINNTNGGYNYQIDSSSTCYNSGSLPSSTIEVGGTCTIIFDNMLPSYYLALPSLGAVYTMNLTVPTIVFEDTVNTNQFTIQPTLPDTFSNSTVVYASAQQATLTNNVSESSGNVTVSNTLANASGYSADTVTVTTNMEDYFSSLYSIASNCSQDNSSESGIRIQTCDLSSSALTGNGIYVVDSSYSGQYLNYIYSISVGSGIVISTGSLSGQLNLN